MGQSCHLQWGRDMNMSWRYSHTSFHESLSFRFRNSKIIYQLWLIISQSLEQESSTMNSTSHTVVQLGREIMQGLWVKTMCKWEEKIIQGLWVKWNGSVCWQEGSPNHGATMTCWPAGRSVTCTCFYFDRITGTICENHEGSPLGTKFFCL